MNFFSILGLPETLDLGQAEIDEGWDRSTRAKHSDDEKDEKRSEAVSQIHKARAVLSDPVSRLEHWLMLKDPEHTSNHSLSPELMDLFGEIQPSIEKADEVLAKHRKSTTALAKALLTKEAIDAQLAIQGCMQKIRPLKEKSVESFPALEEDGRNGDFESAGLTLNRLKFLRKWEQQCQERLLALLEC